MDYYMDNSVGLAVILIYVKLAHAKNAKKRNNSPSVSHEDVCSLCFE